MKNADKSVRPTGNLDNLISKLAENEILNLQALRCVRGGTGEGGGDLIIIPPKPPIIP